MATTSLWDRIIGTDAVYSSEDDQDQKIALHRFWAIMSEWKHGHERTANITGLFEIATGIQHTEVHVIQKYLNVAPDRALFLRMCKDWSYIAENNLHPLAAKYRDFTQFEERMKSEIIDQGGTLP